ncbi:DNA-binding phage protein [Sphingomonas kyeonggiensis]|uniref:Fis family transcriptional regulator n=1 Tax=Sphingomonas kyeonggiensis TaxID=1268553 RepID=UPI00277D61C2|nr:Fis family transcriptional regulator [Sphingomonas kyeonggiensis]MDQ0248197.1 DNA-binding phage protein [Sphingomonas kyeonggiensis]
MVEKQGPRDPSNFTSLNDLLDEDGIREEVTAMAIKQVIADALRGAMKDHGLTKAAMAERMQTSRKQLDRVLDPNEHNVTLETLARAAKSVGRTLKVELA